MAATRFSIMELLGGQAGVTRTPSGRMQELRALWFRPWQPWNHSRAAAPQPEPGGGGSGDAALAGRGRAGLRATRRSWSQAGSFSLCLGTRWWLGTTRNSLARLT